MKSIFLFAAVAALTVGVSSERILFLLPLATRSHVHVFEPLMRALGERGHDIIALSPINSTNMPATVKQIQLITVNDLIGDFPNAFEERKKGLVAEVLNSSVWDHISNACLKVLKNPKLYDEVLNKEKFDLVIVDIFLNQCVLGVIPHFQAPSIFITTYAAPTPISIVVGNRLPPSFVPFDMAPYTDRMPFKERLLNTIFDFVSFYTWDHFVVKKAESTYREYLPNGDSFPSIDDIQGNVSMLFMNSHFTLNYPRPLLPDVIEVGGMHTRPPTKLPKDLDDFLSGSGKDGFIYFSMGSILKPKEIPEETRKAFIRVFSKLKQRVLWKWDTEEMADAPPNVLLRKWLPQQDILGHPNIKLFMTHGGLLSTQESVYHGVPILGLPVFADQDLNIGQAQKGGYAKFVEIVDMSEEKLEEAVTELLNNPIYSQNVKSLSERVRDLPQTPLDKAVYWTEYVLRHKGAPHLRSGARDLNFFQYYLLDVTAVFLSVVILVLFLTLKCCKATCKCVCGRRGKPRHEKKD